MIISILINNVNSWIFDYIDELVFELHKQKHSVFIVTSHQDMNTGDLCFLLGCTKIVPDKYLTFNEYNLAVHESDLPNGKGFSPLAWQILEGKSKIPVVLFDAQIEVDEGLIYERAEIILDGSELLDELRLKQWNATKDLVLRFVHKYPNVVAQRQIGEGSYYRRRTYKDDELSVNMTIRELFNQFRIAENEKWPVYFKYKNNKYFLKIEKSK